MLNTSGLLYLIARIVSAASNLLAVAIFSRLAGPEEYGHYLLVFAWSVIAYGFGAQWMRYAYFGVYHPGRFGEYVASLARLLGCGAAAVAVVLTLLGVFRVFEPGFLVAVFALVCGMTIYEAAFEVARTLLNARGAALSMILRAALTLGLGTTSLWLGGGARGLAIALAVTHVIAAVPALSTFSKVRLSDFSRAASLHIVSYGWPLFLSFGVNAVGQSIDRLLLAHYLGLAALGPYGVVADILRQSFTVLGEAIILSLITVAKQYANAGERSDADKTLKKAFNACLAASTFGTAFFIVFGTAVLQVLLRPEFLAPTAGLVPIFAIAFAFMVMRSFYFGQVIYFTNASYLELVVSLLTLVVSVSLSVLLVPTYSVHGAAIALMVANVVGCLTFVALGRRWYLMPVDFTALAVMPALALLFVFLAHFSADLIASQPLLLAVDMALFAAIGGVAVRYFGLLSLPTDAIPRHADGSPAIAISTSGAVPRLQEVRALAPRPAQIEFLGLPFSLFSQSEVVRAILDRCTASYRYVVTPNAYHVVTAHGEPGKLIPIYRDAWLSLCDSRIIRALARFDRVGLPLVTGSDLVAALLATLNERTPALQRILIVGPGRAAEQKLRAAYPNLTLEVMSAPAGLAQAPEARHAVARACAERPWDILLLCVGCPTQELIAAEIEKLGRKSGIALCVGASVDFLTGTRIRAPLWVQKLSLEWAYRLLQEPGRMWRRYLIESPKILRIFVATRSTDWR